MSLICAHCGKIIVMSNNPDHLGCCGGCSGKLTDADKRRIEESSEVFRKQSIEASRKAGNG